jgi:hypothetical protein
MDGSPLIMARQNSSGLLTMTGGLGQIPLSETEPESAGEESQLNGLVEGAHVVYRASDTAIETQRGKITRVDRTGHQGPAAWTVQLTKTGQILQAEREQLELQQHQQPGLSAPLPPGLSALQPPSHTSFADRLSSGALGRTISTGAQRFAAVLAPATEEDIDEDLHLQGGMIGPGSDPNEMDSHERCVDSMSFCLRFAMRMLLMVSFPTILIPASLLLHDGALEDYPHLTPLKVCVWIMGILFVLGSVALDGLHLRTWGAKFWSGLRFLVSGSLWMIQGAIAIGLFLRWGYKHDWDWDWDNNCFSSLVTKDHKGCEKNFRNYALNISSTSELVNFALEEGVGQNRIQNTLREGFHLRTSNCPAQKIYGCAPVSIYGCVCAVGDLASKYCGTIGTTAACCQNASLPYVQTYTQRLQLQSYMTDECVVTSEYFYPLMAFVFLALVRSHEEALYPGRHNKLLTESSLLNYLWRRLIALMSNGAHVIKVEKHKDQPRDG